MRVIPAINAVSQEEAAALVEKARSFLKAGDWIHFDISEFNMGTSDVPNIDVMLRTSDVQKLNAEIHFMLSNYEELLQPSLEAGAKRIIVQHEILQNLEFVLEECRRTGAEAGISIAPDTPIEELNVYFNKVKFYQVLAVPPGASGQPFQEKVVPKIKWLKEQLPDAIIEVDGGINPETAKLVMEAGANIVVSASYIFEGGEPEKRYAQLEKI